MSPETARKSAPICYSTETAIESPARKLSILSDGTHSDQLSPRFKYEEYPVSRYQRLFEIAVAALALVLSLPLMLVIAIIIRLDTPGSPLFFQARLAKGTRLFRFLKFRTLYADAEERYPDLYDYRYTERELNELRFKMEDDPRVTPAGEWLRKSSLDELPNFWCVLKGDMALVGPRPEIPEMLPYYRGEMLRKFQVRPGITGLAQVSGRGRLGFHETVALDVEYVKNRTFWYDCKIILLTIWRVLTCNGAF